VRAHLEKLHHPEWIAAAEKRAPAIETEIATTTVVSQLPPPAPFVVTGPVPTASPNLPSSENSGPAVKLPSVHATSDAPPLSSKPAAGSPVKLVLPTGRHVDWPNFAALERAADRGEPGAPAALGQVLLAGRLAPADPLRAVTLLERAAQAGSADAAHFLADLYTKGDHVPRDDAKAFAYTLQAAEGGSLQAMFNTGVLYANGRGTARDDTAALTWLLVAKHYGLDQGAEKRIRAQLEKTAPAQIPLAEKRAADLPHEIEAVVAKPDRP
jgi:Sel1 repeat